MTERNDSRTEGRDDSRTEGNRPLPADITPDAQLRTGAEQPVDPQDLAMAEGTDPTPQAVERAERRLRERGNRAVDEATP